MSLIQFLSLLACTLPIAAGAWAAARRLVNVSRCVNQFSIQGVLIIQIAVSAIVAAGLLLGTFGLLKPIYALIAALLIGASLFAFGDVGHRMRFGARKWPPADCILLAILVGTILWTVGRAITAPTYDYDVLTYHLFFPANWVQNSAISIVPTWFGDPAPAYAPSATEVFYAWLMLPLSSDLAARGGQWPFWILLIMAFGGLLRELRVVRSVRLIACTAVALIPTIASQAATAMVDVALAAHMLCVALFALRMRRASTPENVVGLSLAIGLMLGTKFLAIAYLAALSPLVAWAVVSALRSRSPARKTQIRNNRMACIFAMLIAAWVGGYWYVRNLVVTGNPVYPLAVRIGGVEWFGGAYGREQMANSSFNARRVGGSTALIDAMNRSLRNRIDSGDGTRSELSSLLSRVTPPLWIIGGLYAASTVALLQGVRRRPAIVVYHLCAAATLCVFWWGLPFQQSRFAWGPILLIFAGGLSMARGRGNLRYAVIALVVLAWAWTLAREQLIALFHGTHVFIPSISLIAASLCTWCFVRSAKRAGLFVYAALILVVLYCGRFAMTDARQNALRHPRWAGVGEAWEWIGTNVTDQTIAYVGNNVPYFLMGPRFNNRVLYVPARGDAAWRFDAFARDAKWQALGPPNTSEPAPDRRVMDPRAWHSNLVAVGVDYVIVFALYPNALVNHRHDVEGFTIERQWLDKLAGHSCAELNFSVAGRAYMYKLLDRPSDAFLAELPKIIQNETDAIHRRQIDGTPPDQPIRHYPHAAWMIDRDGLVPLKHVALP